MNISGEEGEVRATVQVTRAATGKTETYELVGRVTRRKPVVHDAVGVLEGMGASLSTEGAEQ